MSDKEIVDKFSSTKAIAKKLGVSDVTLKKWRHDKTINLPYYKFGRSVRYLMSDVDKFIASQRQEDKSHE